MANGFQGLMGNLNDAIAQGMQSPLFNLGTGLIAGAQPFQNPGTQLQAAAQGQQAEQQQALQNRMAQYNMQMMQNSWPAAMQILQHLGLAMGAPQSSGSSSSGKSSSKSQKQINQQSTAGGLAAPVVGPYSALPSAPAGSGSGGGLMGAPSAPVPSGGLLGAGGTSPTSPTSGAPASAGGMDPMTLMRAGTALSAFPIPMMQNLGRALVQEGKFAAQYDPNYATRMAAAKSTLAQDQAMYAQAQQSGDKLGMQAARMKYLTDAKLVSVAAYNGATTMFGGLTPKDLGMSTTNPVQGVQITNGAESPIPGAVAAQQALAGGRARGEAQGETARVYDRATQTYRVIPRSWVVDGGNASGGSGGAAAPGGFVAAPGPQQQAYSAGTGRESAEQVGSLQEAANAAKQANFTLDQILKDSASVVTGPTAGARKWMDTVLGSGMQLFGAAPPKALGTYQELDKYANQVAFAASRQLGSREAGQIVQLERESNPNKSIVPTALRDLIGASHAANDYVIAQNQYVQTVAQRNGGNAEIAQANWTSTTDPRVWELAVSPELAAKWAPQIGLSKVAKVMPYMLPETAYNAFRNLPRPSQEALVKQLDPAFMGQMVNAAR